MTLEPEAVHISLNKEICSRQVQLEEENKKLIAALEVL